MDELNLVYTPKRKKKGISSKKSEALWAYLFIAVPVIGFLVFTVSALCFSFYTSFTDFNPIKGTYTWVGLQNYIDIFQEDNFKTAALNTVILLLSIPVGVFLGLLLATYLKRLAKGRTWLTVIYYLPAVTSSIAIMLVFRDLFKNDNGLINTLFGLDLKWIASDPWLIKIVIILKNIWGSVGGTMILYLAGLQNIPESYYEAAKVNGASKWRQFVDITLPMSHPTSFYLIVTGIITGLQSYADSQILGAGLPGARTIVYYIWSYGINQAKYGYASAASILLSVVTLVITILLFSKSSMIKESTK